jgi:hypothetical protein
MPNDSETRVERMAHFSWSWKGNCCLVCVVGRGLEHGATGTVGSTLQTLSAVAVVNCEASWLKGRGDWLSTEYIASEETEHSICCPPEEGLTCRPYPSSLLALLVFLLGRGWFIGEGHANTTMCTKRVMMKPPW